MVYKYLKGSWKVYIEDIRLLAGTLRHLYDYLPINLKYVFRFLSKLQLPPSLENEQEVGQPHGPMAITTKCRTSFVKNSNKTFNFKQFWGRK